jgi:hypothetical protein
MLGTEDVDEELQRGFGLSINELEPFLKVGLSTSHKMPSRRHRLQNEAAERVVMFRCLFRYA